MATSNLEELKSDLADYLAARKAILVAGQSYSSGSGKTLTRADLALVERRIQELRAEISAAESGSSGVFFGDIRRAFK